MSVLCLGEAMVDLICPVALPEACEAAARASESWGATGPAAAPAP